jgi:hypothetical protein
MVTSHVLAGVLVGRALRGRPIAAFGAGVVSHLVMDSCPHWGVVAGEPGGRERFLRVARCDGCAALVAMAVGAGLATAGDRSAVLGAMAGAAVVDADKPCEYFFGFNPFPKSFQRLHSMIQRESPRRLPHEVAVAVGLLAVVLWGAGRQAQ